MRKILFLFASFFLCMYICGCANETTQVVATTLPVYEFTTMLCEGTDIAVSQLITESVSCLHDYSLQVRQMQSIEEAELLIISGGGLEDFLGDSIYSANKLIDASSGIVLTCHVEHREQQHEVSHSGHSHEIDPHFWLAPENAILMVKNISDGLKDAYPQHLQVLVQNENSLIEKLQELQDYGNRELADLSTRELITFHDGFSYLADAFDLTVIRAIEEESGSEASAFELIELIGIVSEHQIPSIFIERNGSSSAASIIAEETGASIYTLDMALSGNSYFSAMYHNIDTLKEALK